MLHDVVIIGGGPAGLSAALALGRARKRVLVCDGGPRRNAAAVNVHNFVSRDGIAPQAFRDVSREQLALYPNVAFADGVVARIGGARGAFEVELGTGVVSARRILLATGMIDEMLPIPGFSELWGRSIFQCPYCHGWEIQDRAWAYLARPSHVGHFALFAQQLRAWTRDLVVLTNAAFEVPEDARETLTRAGVRIETAEVTRLVTRGDRLESIEVGGGRLLRCEALFCHPPQRQIDLVVALELKLDDDGFVAVDPMKRETSLPGIYAGGDLTTRMQGALLAAASGTQAAIMVNLDVTTELVAEGLA
jgi:thioredoxin reductase